MADPSLARSVPSGKTVLIYTLSAPNGGAVRYVGMTSTSLRTRCSSHICAGNKGDRTHVARWVRSLLTKGLRPVITEIDQVAVGGDWKAAERYWIAHHRALGANLANLTDGGEGVLGWTMPEEQRARLAEFRTGMKHSAETRAVLSARKQGAMHNYYGKRRPAETCAKIAAAKTGARNPMFGRCGENHPNARPVIVDGVRYVTAAEAGRALGIHRTAIIGRIKRGTAAYADQTDPGGNAGRAA